MCVRVYASFSILLLITIKKKNKAAPAIIIIAIGGPATKIEGNA